MRFTRSLRLASRLVAVGACSSFALAGGVRVVEPTGTANFSDLQSAIDAAVDGDVLLVGAGTYGGFTIDGKDLFIAAKPGASVKIQGTVRVQNLSFQNVVLCGLELRGSPLPPLGPALVLDNDAGQVRLQNCKIAPVADSNHDAISATGADKVVFASCTIEGPEGISGINVPAGPGGAGLRAVSSQVLLYDTQLSGGHGGFGDDGDGGDAGGAALLFSSVLFASGSRITGGDGGNCYIYNAFSLQPGDGGPGLSLDGGASATLLDTPLAGGFGGFELHFQNTFGQPGPALINNGGTLTTLPGKARKFTAAYASADNAALAVSVQGVAGDRVFATRSFSFGFAFVPALSGYWLVPTPFYAPGVPLGVVPPSGVLLTNVRLADLQAPKVSSRINFQGYVITAQGGSVIGSPFHVASLNQSSGPDCNGNGKSDFVDAIQGFGTDCDTNLIDDGCELAAHDCNSNGVLDRCDIANGTSPDLNLNGIPDECEPTQTTWYVDDNGSPSGTGSAANPYQSLAQAFGIAQSGDRILVADGNYTGVLNIHLDFGNRELAVESMNGPANCVIALIGGRAFNVLQGQTAASRIAGFTIRGAVASAIRVYQASPVIEACVFENDSAFLSSPSSGGGVRIEGGSPLVRGCTFRQCAAYDGGGIGIFGGNPRIEGCDFVGNTADNYGGAVAVQDVNTPSSVLISHCTFLGNRAVPNFSGLGWGGAIALHADLGATGYVVENCLIAGNFANNRGGGIETTGLTTITGCTVVDNSSAGYGGGVHDAAISACGLFDSILWNNSAPHGGQISMLFGGVLDVRSSDVQGGKAGVDLGFGGTLVWGNENINSDPAFVDRDGPDNDPLTLGDNNWRLLANSRCVDRGNNSLVALDALDLDGDGNVTEPTPFDLDGAPRFVEIPSAPNTGVGTAPFVDFGCYERQP